MQLLNIKTTIDKSWTLFLDRDGVINVETVGSYVTMWKDFQFHEGALEALQLLRSIFGSIVVVSNQRGVGKGIMTIETLRDINKNMRAAIIEAGGRLDRVYTCTAVADNDHNRKPNIGMGLQAREDIPGIDFRRSIMIGNNVSDMEFGKRLAMHTVFLTTTRPPVDMPHDLIDEQCPSLLAWARTIPKPEPAF